VHARPGGRCRRHLRDASAFAPIRKTADLHDFDRRSAMAMELSDLLAKLADQAKTIEAGFADLAQTTDAAAEARRERAQTAARTAVDQLDQNLMATNDATAANWRALTTRIGETVAAMQTEIAQRQYARDIVQAQQRAIDAKAQAARAIQFATAAVDAAGAAAYDYDVARRAADALNQS
jgi:hypothetical protein